MEREPEIPKRKSHKKKLIYLAIIIVIILICAGSAFLIFHKKAPAQPIKSVSSKPKTAAVAITTATPSSIRIIMTGDWIAHDFSQCSSTTEQQDL